MAFDAKTQALLDATRELADRFFGRIPNSTLKKKFQMKPTYLVLDFRPKQLSRPTKYPRVKQ
jgi:hypothetical protein